MLPSHSQPIDSLAYAALERLPRNPFHFLVRHDAQAAATEREHFEKHGHNPLFFYPEAKSLNTKNYLEAVDRLLHDLPTLARDPVIEDLYRAKIEELKERALLVQAVQNQRDEEVTRLSEQIFSPPEELAQELKTELSELTHESTTLFAHKEKIQAPQFKQMVQATLHHYGMSHWMIEDCETSSVRIKHGHAGTPPKILLPKILSLTKNRAIRLLTHEIEVHALRTENGRQSPLLLLGRGLDHYLDTEEGLAMYFQERVSSARHAPGFWDAYATALTRQGNFVSVYETLREARTALARKAGRAEPEQLGRDAAWRLCLRAYRGIHNTSHVGVGYRRDHIYRSGLLRVKRALGADPTLLSVLFQGNMGLQHAARIKNLNLEHGRQPEMIAKDVVESMMRVVK